MSVFDAIVEEKLLGMKTAFIGKIVSFDAAKRIASVQPLTMIKQYGQTAKTAAIVPEVPVLHNAMYKLYWYYNTCLKDGNKGCTVSGTSVNCSCTEEQRLHVGMRYIVPGDICVCVCSDRDITDTSKGSMATPSIRHHDISDAIVVGILGQDVPEYTSDPPMVK